MNDLGLEPEYLWLIGAIILAIAEIIVPGVFMIWLAAGAALTGLATLVFGPPVAFQFALFALLSLAAVHVGRRWYAAHPVASSDPLLNDRASRLVGRNVVVETAIEGGSGRVKVGDSVWNCRGEDCEAGARVRVVGADGTCLLVEPLSPALPSG
jgi:membrane protein implicated in regulation of membrane protease activity